MTAPQDEVSHDAVGDRLLDVVVVSPCGPFDVAHKVAGCPRQLTSGIVRETTVNVTRRREKFRWRRLSIAGHSSRPAAGC